MNSELKELLQSVIREELQPIHEHLEKIETDQQEMKQEMKQEIQEIRVDQQEMKRAVLDTNERVMEIGDFLENQHRTIELLSARSIQQEAELKSVIKTQKA
ncbi:hypothetical protein [Paenibacillus medicaginis]|uniref:Uncharacterized protein n=1 Tax=Paenibacillus medicaginis TaxID=1470560 RepID=A0ABV5C477_9BACL